jgi:hypothetical protein
MPFQLFIHIYQKINLSVIGCGTDLKVHIKSVIDSAILVVVLFIGPLVELIYRIWRGGLHIDFKLDVFVLSSYIVVFSFFFVDYKNTYSVSYSGRSHLSWLFYRYF